MTHEGEGIHGIVEDFLKKVFSVKAPVQLLPQITWS